LSANLNLKDLNKRKKRKNGTVLDTWLGLVFVNILLQD